MICILEDGAMACLRINNQLAAGNFIMHVIGIFSRNLHIMIPIDDEGRLIDKG